jgi:D-alanyl-D-alanine carboxypeptidase (penicillin-binding protein 5/6)
MSRLFEPDDAVTQLTEIMQHEQVIEKPTVAPEVRRKRRRFGIVIAGITILAILAAAGSYVGIVLNLPLGDADATSEVPEVSPAEPATVAMSPEGASAVSASGGEDYLGPDAAGIWATSGGNDARPIASITKLITALVILDRKPLSGPDDPGPTLTFDKADHALYDKYYVLGATIAAMPTNSTMSQHDALEMMLVASATNYAEAVAGWAFGSNGAFVTATRNWLAASGLTQTTIVEPTGIDARNTSTPTDLIALARIAQANPVVAQIVAMPATDIPNFDSMLNTNDILGTGGVDGLKTGTLDGIGSNLLFTAKLPVGLDEPLSVTGVVLGGYSHESVNLDVVTLLKSIANGFHDVHLGTGGQTVGRYTTPWGESADMVLGESASIYTWSDTPVTATMETTTLTTGAQGEQVGSVTWTAGPNTVTVPVVLDRTIAPPDDWWKLTHPFELGGER